MVLFFFFKQKTAYEMRISDWSSDVCSSDLRARSKPSIILGEHDREHAPRERCVRWIFRSEFEGGIIIVDLEEDAFAPKIEGAEVSFRAVAGAKVIPADGGEEFSLGNDFTNRVFFACETSEAGAGHDKASGRIETLAATVDRKSTRLNSRH